MKVKITEAQLNKLLIERSGYVENTVELAQYLYSTYYNFIIKKYNINDNNKDEFINFLPSIFEEDETIANLKLNSDFLQRYNINFTKILNVSLMYSTKKGGVLKTNEFKQNNNKIEYCQIDLNIKLFLYEKADVIQTIQHELTHAYEYSQRLLKNGAEHMDNTMENNFYPSFEDTTVISDNVQTIIYVLNKMEQNANVSALYSFLKTNNANRNNYKDILKESSITRHLLLLEKTKNIFIKNAKNVVTEIYKLSQQSEYSDIFPSSKNMTLERYQKRLINMVTSKINKINEKVKKVIGIYLTKIES